MSRDYSFARSFMWLCFTMASLLVLGQFGLTSMTRASAEGWPQRWTMLSSQTATPTEPQTEVIVSLGDRQVSLYRDGEAIAAYDIAVGRTGWETPSGKFQIINMQVNPIWQHPFTGDLVPTGEGNPLGTRWIGFWSDGTHQIGFHGTDDTNLLGQAVSHGCIRMRNVDIQALYSQVGVGTPVIVRP
jgi:lipoprotein-anchoring transpeptidase ErfK/SrfK